jgi:choline dehydrogenase-like flavoprotein
MDDAVRPSIERDKLIDSTTTGRRSGKMHRKDTLREYYGPLIQPGPNDSWADFAKSTYNSYHHGVGTCMMGPASDPAAVVDAGLRVHGLENLYLADASIMPTVTHANTNVATIMIAERLTDFLR